MLALPMALARRLAASHAAYHNEATTDAERNAIVLNALADLRDHDTNISVWDLLPIFDRSALS